ncbi:hypothetical protein OOZ63_28185 [Paucibacter sp. PLA-PC-4]|nr:hypothetical protein [Paucibacter sp. PLA-PC-4]
MLEDHLHGHLRGAFYCRRGAGERRCIKFGLMPDHDALSLNLVFRLLQLADLSFDLVLSGVSQFRANQNLIDDLAAMGDGKVHPGGGDREGALAPNSSNHPLAVKAASALTAGGGAADQMASDFTTVAG